MNNSYLKKMNSTNFTKSNDIDDDKKLFIMFIFIYSIIIFSGIYLLYNYIYGCIQIIIHIFISLNHNNIKIIQIIIFKPLNEKIMTFKEIVINN